MDRVTLQLALRLLLLTSFSSTVSYLLSLLQSVVTLACSLDASPCMPAVVLYPVLFKVPYYKIKNFFFIVF